MNGCVKYEFDTRIGVAVYVKHKPWRAAARMGRRRRPDQNHNMPEIFGI